MNDNLREKIYSHVCASQLRALMNNIADQNHADFITDEIMSLISQSESKETDSNEVKELINIISQNHSGDFGEGHRIAKSILQAGYTKNNGEKVSVMPPYAGHKDSFCKDCNVYGHGQDWHDLYRKYVKGEA